MRRNTARLLVGLLLLVGSERLEEGATAADPLPAFPTAEGFGARSLGGRGGTVYHVTNLDDVGPGSLRHGVEAAQGPTTIVFDVGGTIRLLSPLWLCKDRVTLAGQTAPGDGVTIAGDTFGIAKSSDIVVRYLRFRCGGSLPDRDSLSLVDSHDVILDHISTSWGTDETLSVTLSNNVTVQNSIIAEALDLPGKHHAYGSLVRGNVDDAHPGGYTFAHNLWIGNTRRNPAIGSRQTYGRPDDVHAALHLDLVNNVICNWGSRPINTVRSDRDVCINLVNNMFIAGPDTWNGKEVLTLEFQTTPEGNGNVRLYESGNQIDSNRDAVHDPTCVTRAMYHDWNMYADFEFLEAPHPFPAVRKETAQEAYGAALVHVGASLVRDAVDTRLIADVIQRKGAIIGSEEMVGGFPKLSSGTPPADQDRDGMPDVWEKASGLDPNDPGDGSRTAANGYTNLENYLNFLAGDVPMDHQQPSGEPASQPSR